MVFSKRLGFVGWNACLFRGELLSASRQGYSAMWCVAGGGGGERSDGDDDMFADSDDEKQPAPDTAAAAGSDKPAAADRPAAEDAAAAEQGAAQPKPDVAPVAGACPAMETDSTQRRHKICCAWILVDMTGQYFSVTR